MSCVENPGIPIELHVEVNYRLKYVSPIVSSIVSDQMEELGLGESSETSSLGTAQIMYRAVQFEKTPDAWNLITDP